VSALECEWYDLIRREDAKDEDFKLEYAAIEEYRGKYDRKRVKYNTHGLECPSRLHVGN
jgi:hypothetical protein